MPLEDDREGTRCAAESILPPPIVDPAPNIDHLNASGNRAYKMHDDVWGASRQHAHVLTFAPSAPMLECVDAAADDHAAAVASTAA